MKEFDVRIKKCNDVSDIGQLYAAINDEDELRVNGSIMVPDSIPENPGYCEVYANPFRFNRAIHFMLEDTINDKNEFQIDGLVKASNNNPENLGYCEVYVNLCRSDGAILYVLEDHDRYELIPGSYYSFSAYRPYLSEYINLDDFAYVEIYLRFKRDPK